MYSPKIREDYIPLIYRLAQKRRMHMTALVNEIIGAALKKDQIGNKAQRQRN